MRILLAIRMGSRYLLTPAISNDLYMHSSDKAPAEYLVSPPPSRLNISRVTSATLSEASSLGDPLTRSKMQLVLQVLHKLTAGKHT